MANPFGEIAGKIAGEVAEGLAKKAAPVVSGAVKKATKAVDDWGWKGGKPGEVTGSMFKSTDLRNDTDRVWTRASEQIRKATKSGKLPESNQTPDVNVKKTMSGFAELEEADIPREWTARVLKSVNKRRNPAGGQLLVPYTPNAISKAMRPLTNEQRETFVSLYPEWEGSLEELARASKSL